MAAFTPTELAQEIVGPILWRRETARRLLAENPASATVAAARLRSLLAKRPASVTTQISAFRTLDQLGQITPEDLAPSVSHSDPAVRRHALQMSERWLPKEEGRALLDAVLDAAAAEKDPQVAIQFALTLGESRDPRAFAMLVRYAREKLALRWMDAALLSSLAQRCGDMLIALLPDAQPPAAFLDQLARAIASRRDEAELTRVLASLSTVPPHNKPPSSPASRKAAPTRNASRSPHPPPCASSRSSPRVRPPKYARPPARSRKRSCRSRLDRIPRPA
jgi:hypothetical protein